MPAPKLCPSCGLYNLPDAVVCDCGFDFVRGVQPPGTITKPGPVRVSFWAVVVALPLWLVGAVAVSSELAAAAAVVYGLLCLALWPLAAYATSRWLGPLVARLVRPLHPLLKFAALTLGFGAVAAAIYRTSPPEGEVATAGAALSITLAFAFGPAVYVGCMAYLVAAAIRKRRNAG